MLPNEPVDGLSSGYMGFIQVGQLIENGCSKIENAPGVYLILRRSVKPPVFLEKGSGGWIKGVDPNVSLSTLIDKWVDGTEIMYIGKASTPLRERLGKYMRFGDGIPSPHHGGRYIWQLADSRELLVCWKVLPVTIDPEQYEKIMIKEFEKIHGKLPFANLRH